MFIHKKKLYFSGTNIRKKIVQRKMMNGIALKDEHLKIPSKSNIQKSPGSVIPSNTA